MLHRKTGYPINPYTGFERGSYYDWDRVVQPSGGAALIGLFPTYRAPAGSGPYPGLH